MAPTKDKSMPIAQCTYYSYNEFQLTVTLDILCHWKAGLWAQSRTHLTSSGYLV